MENSENLERRASWRIEDEVREDLVEQHVSVCEVGAAVADGWKFSQLEENLSRR